MAQTPLTSCWPRQCTRPRVGKALLIVAWMTVAILSALLIVVMNWIVNMQSPQWQATKGLTLMVENACEDKWTTYFDQAILDWNETKALNLQPHKVEHDGECSFSWGRLKVCNSDYGATGWAGQASYLFNLRGHIVASVAKMNDYYPSTTSYYSQYLMCHEIGHGFGLPHSDENMTNIDLGECMDYARDSKNNMEPGDANFDLLEAWYGTPDETGDTGNDPTDYGESYVDKEKANGNHQFRTLRGVSYFETTPPTSVESAESLLRQVETKAHNCEGIICAFNFGNGFSVKTVNLVFRP